MKRVLKLFLPIAFVLTLTACIGENYDFSPPTVSLYNHDSTNKIILTEGNINWHHDESYNKEVKDIVSFAKKQDKIYFNAGQKVEYSLEDGNFDYRTISIYLLKDKENIKIEFDINLQEFYLPNEIGEYIIVVEIPTNTGDAQYLGNLVIQ